MSNQDSLFRLIDGFRKIMNQELQAKRIGIGGGHFNDIVQYKQQCGVISGLESALNMFNERVKNLEVDEEELQERKQLIEQEVEL